MFVPHFANDCQVPGPLIELLAQGQGSAGMIDSLPAWSEAGEIPESREYIFHYHTMMCPQFANGYCPRHKGSRLVPPQCFHYHIGTQRRRPLVDSSGHLRYWDVLCEYVAQGADCPSGDLCLYAHTREEISYHAAKYKTKLCNDRDCRGQEVCCFAHGESELRTGALERYSFWSVYGATGGWYGTSNAETEYGIRCPPDALQQPKVYKHRFCASYPNIASCRRGDMCAFAHTRSEIRTPLLSEEEECQKHAALTNEFFMFKFKTFWCPIGVQHDWQTCVYAHNYQDARRHPGIGYGPRPCPHWKRKETTLEYAQRCPLGVRCPFSHGAKEQLYHPAYFKTVTCQDWPNANCPRGNLCAFWHKRCQQRARPATVEDDYDYDSPLSELQIETLQPDFVSPPSKLFNSIQTEPTQQAHVHSPLGTDHSASPGHKATAGNVEIFLNSKGNPMDGDGEAASDSTTCSDETQGMMYDDKFAQQVWLCSTVGNEYTMYSGYQVFMADPKWDMSHCQYQYGQDMMMGCVSGADMMVYIAPEASPTDCIREEVPTFNGFIHFKESSDSDGEDVIKCRRRSSSF
mmetsp:Transcript_3061/g.8868  ORF Transcript_3061/g.8868 Transcript_3061/m.8868 type:complete len:574 (-) Transcript_3061:347-2068(-)